MAIPKLPKGRIRITYTTGTDAITDLWAAVFHHHVVDRVDEDLFHVLDFRLTENIVLIVQV